MRVIVAAARLWAMLGGLVLLAIVAVTATNVGAFALDRLARLWGGEVGGLPGYEDFVRLAIGAAIPMFLPWCQAERGHLAVDLFLARAPAGLKRGIDRVSLVLMAAMALFLAYWMANGLIESRSDGALSPVLGWPVWPFYAGGIVSLVLWAVIALGQAVTPLPPEPEAARHG